MVYNNKYVGFGIGHGPHVNSIYHYYETLIGMLGLELCDQILSDAGDGNSCRSLIHPYFISFQEWCRDIYEELKSDQDKVFFLFRDISVQYQLSKKDSFYEKENKIFHGLMSKPISSEGDGIQQMALVIYEYHNLAINCLEDYVTRLKSPSLTIDKSHKEASPSILKGKSKLNGFNVINQDCLKDAYNQFINLEIISNKVDFLDFVNAFLGRTPNNKITWLKGPGLLSYFIKSINGIGIRDEKKNIWKTTLNCFQDSNGNDFDIVQLRHGKVPKNIEEIQMVIDTFNQNSYQEE